MVYIKSNLLRPMEKMRFNKIRPQKSCEDNVVEMSLVPKICEEDVVEMYPFQRRSEDEVVERNQSQRPIKKNVHDIYSIPKDLWRRCG
jgi:hypothetical protein